MTLQETQRRVAALRRRLQEAGLDGLVVVDGANRRYLSGLASSAGVALIPRDEAHPPTLLVDARYTEQARVQAPGYRVIQHGDHVWDDLRGVLEAYGIRRLGFEAEHLSYRQAVRWQEAIPGVTWVPVDHQVEALRAVKSAAELERLRRAVRIADEAFAAVVPALRAGMSEREVAWRLEAFMRERGAERMAFDLIVGSGPNAALPHAAPGPRRLQPGDTVVLDFGCVYEGYHSDMTRTVVVGPTVEPRAQEVYRLVLEAQQAGIRAIRPGVTGREVDAAARQVIEAAGFGEYFGHGLGHGVGLEVHEPIPRLSRTSDTVLEPGMVTSVEPGVYIPGWGGVRIEDLVLVTETGCEILTSSPKDLIVVPS
ncbi:MAG TPA: Xaa-Pro peptidase family protein [Limnochordales bacterium]